MESPPGTDLELSDGWLAAAADDHLRRSYTEHDFDDAAWHPIAVPGHWRSSPGFADSDGPLLHRCRFEAPAPEAGRRSWLTFDGLFYQGDVWLDGGYLGDTEGYFLPHSFEITDALRDRSEHALAVEVTCNASPATAPRRNITGAFQGAAYLDPEWNPGGIWRPVRNTTTGPVRIASLRVVCREANVERAVVSLRAVLDSDGSRRVRLRNEVGGHDHELDQPLAAGANEVNWAVTIERPALWWPRALGDAVLHDVRVAVMLAPGDAAGSAPGAESVPQTGDTGHGRDGDSAPADDAAGLVSDERRLRTGLRSVRLRRWIASVNGQRLFLKGTTIGPTRMALGEATPADLRGDAELAVEAGLDLVRVHAHVSRPELYEAADELGLLLWQDMPLHGVHARGVRKQAVRQAGALVDLLGHHPSIALWCGHDEPMAPVERPPVMTGPGTVVAAAGRAVEHQVPTWNRSVLDASIKRALHKADSSRPVVAHSGVAPHVPQLDGTDSHLDLGWSRGDERDLPALARRIPRLVRFVGRFGAQAVPSGDGAAFAEPERWPDIDWDRLEARHALQKDVFDARVPAEGYATFAGWRDATQRYQATLVRRHVEELRRLKYRPTGGFTQFLFADGHPGVTWSVLDHERRPKLAFDALRAACRPVIVVADRLPTTVVGGEPLALDVHVVSDLRVAVDDTRVTARLEWPGGHHDWNWGGDIPADSCVRVGTLQTVVPEADGPLRLDLGLHLSRQDVIVNHYRSTIVR